MKIFLAICAFSAFFSSVICEDPEYNIVTIHEGNGLPDSLFWTGDNLFFVDTLTNELCCYRLEEEEVFCAEIAGSHISFAVPVERNRFKFVVGSTNHILLVHWMSTKSRRRTSYKVLMNLGQVTHSNKANYGAVDLKGQLVIGTLNNPGVNGHEWWGEVYSLDENLVLSRQIQYCLASGFVWANTNPAKFYFIDALTHEIGSYHYDTHYGFILPDSREVVYDLRPYFAEHQIQGHPGRPAIDRRGFLWVPIYGGSRVLEIDPHTRAVGRSIGIRAARVSSCTFGGPAYSILYVATMGYGYHNPNETRPEGDFGGHIFAVKNLGVLGVPSRRYSLNPEIMNVPHVH